MGLFNIFKSKKQSHSPELIEIFLTVLDSVMNISEAHLKERIKSWNLEDKSLIVTLGYMSGFIDAAYHLTKQPMYDKKYVDSIFIARVEKHLSWIPGIDPYLNLTNAMGMPFLGNLYDYACFIEALSVGGNDLVRFLNKEPFWYPRIFGLLEKTIEDQAPEKMQRQPDQKWQYQAAKKWNYNASSRILRNNITRTEYSASNYRREGDGYVINSKADTYARDFDIDIK